VCVCVCVCIWAYLIHILFRLVPGETSVVLIGTNALLCVRRLDALRENAIVMNSHAFVISHFFCRCLAKLPWAVPSFDGVIIVLPQCIKNKIMGSIIFIWYHAQTQTWSISPFRTSVQWFRCRDLFECTCVDTYDGKQRYGSLKCVLCGFWILYYVLIYFMDISQFRIEISVRSLEFLVLRVVFYFCSTDFW
jgi:hypothetical protein